ncbi:hypothetical protein JQX08_08040 [Pseudomonas sp. UL073]|uniref:Thioesterase family protein n=1 Tax=Zestomonas insulae TaxID=2809017 RepID=A0ABS2IDC3_9GAMM|nr:hypothetical protein [Pseudomonas insulae]MBM7060658.1 hypothetical protein [Pseudomonas insulae]
MQIEHFTIDERFCGPPKSGNGGYTAGRMAAHLLGTVAARLKAPPPLGVELRLESSASEARLFDGTTLLGEAKPTTLELTPPPCPPYAEAEAAVAGFPGFTTHNFPGCFVCGPERAAHDGLRIFPGPLHGTTTLAAPWLPDASLADTAGIVKPEFIWAALDCAGAFALYPIPDGLAIVLGELVVSTLAPLQADEQCVVLGWPLGSEGRKRFAGTALYGADQRLVAVARAVWVEVPASSWN